MNINDELINVTQSNDKQCHTQEYPIISDGTHSIYNTILNIRMPQKLKDKIHRQAEEFGMSTSSLAKAVLAQAFIK